MGNVKPIHHEPARVNQLSKELLTSGAIGAVKGGVIGLSTGLLLRYFSPTYRHIRTPLRVLYQVGWISVGAVFWADKQLISFEERMHQQEHLRRQKILDEAADRGIFLEDDRRNLDSGVHVSSTKD